MSASGVTVQYRVAFGKKDEVIEGPDDATLVITVAAPDATLDPQIAFMRGKLKATGPTGELFALLQTDEVAAVLSRLSTR
ncbi:MAG: hypothetical protein JWN62_4246 [Acidimicrobiales bacterium]|nr:hypothetical protein [Acidimicrobiales bacterium]